MFKGGGLPKHALRYVIAINNNTRLPNDVMSRQGLIGICGEYVPEHVLAGGTCPNIFEGVRHRY